MAHDQKLHTRHLPERPGVYIMKDTKGTIIYVGKANNVKKRVSSYFVGTKDPKTRVLVKNIESIETITTRNHYEALLLENTLIKKWQPRYNINLKDGKSYPVIRITNEEYPRVFRTRRMIYNGSSYFGPFPDVRKLDAYLALIEKLFPLRKCKGPIKKKEYPCLYFHINRCSGACAGKITKEAYLERVSHIRALLEGHTDQLVESLKAKMESAAQELRFEEAATHRDAMHVVEELGREQEVVDFDPQTRDYIAAVERDHRCAFVVLQMRSGKLVGRDLFRSDNYADLAEALNQFIVQYYTGRSPLPDKVYVSEAVDAALIGEFFSRELEKQMEVIVPDSDRHDSILRMAMENGVEAIEEEQRRKKYGADLVELQTVLGLDRLPRRIEGFDISQLSGTHSVASMVSFLDGFPDKKHYRSFHIKTLDGKIDDFAAMREVVARRYTAVVNEGLERPDLILVDGGKGQVAAAHAILKALEIDSIPLAGLAKREEEIFLPGKPDPYRLPETSGALKVLQRVRDESHRFATSFNKRLRAKDVKLGILEAVPGIGPKRASALIKEFGSMKAIGQAGAERISETCKISTDLAETVIEAVRKAADRMATGHESISSESRRMSP